MALSINANNNTEAGAWEFKLVGEVDISNAHYFKNRLEAALAEKKQNILIDLADLNYIDSTGLGVIIGAYGTIKKDGFGIKVTGPKDNVKKLLGISGLDKILC
ncbi:MAG: STAS domain-containing protein [Clostridiales Family XIII bacterium]|jgi:anti-sigma B factor antagonist|nr:STAS domain-containing protein [Clostridiales Family XIII bacterium]